MQIVVTIINNQLVNETPEIPALPTGRQFGNPDLYTYETSTTDSDGDQIYYQWCWEDGDTSDWLGPYNSGEPCSEDHSWTSAGTYYPKVRAKDEFDWESDYSDSLEVTIYEYICGDADGNDIVEISDAVFLINFVFVPESPAPDPYESGDADCSGVVEVSDAVYIVSYVFIPGSPPPCDTDNDEVPDC